MPVFYTYWVIYDSLFPIWNILGNKNIPTDFICLRVDISTTEKRIINYAGKYKGWVLSQIDTEYIPALSKEVT